MNLRRKLITGTSVVVLSLGMVTLVGAGSALAASAHKSGGAAKGTVSCTGTSGTIDFNPPLTETGTSKETSKLVDLALGTCTSSGASVTPTKVSATVKGSSTNSCESFANSTASDTVTFKISWSGASSTSVLFKPGTISVASGDTGFTGSGGVAKGSYATSSASFTVNISTGAVKALTDCLSGTATVSSISISGGNSTL